MILNLIFLLGELIELDLDRRPGGIPLILIPFWAEKGERK
jgi:hypothetical protein